MKVLVCGGRDYSDGDRVYTELDKLRPNVVIEGGAQGADFFARVWADRNLRDGCCLSYKANWDIHGKAAGPIRNQWMLVNGCPDLVLAFPGGRGTADMVRRAKRAGIRVIEIE